MNADIKTIVERGLANKVQFNVQKTQATTLTKKSHDDLPTVEMESHPMVESPSVKLLGININNNMSWHDHVASVAKTASQKLGVLFRCRKLYTPELLLYKAQIRPSLEYCSHVWGCAPKHSLKLLDTTQKRAIRLIDTPNLTKNLHSLEHRRRVVDLSLFYRLYHGRCSSELSQIITLQAVRTRNTREALRAHPYQVEVLTPRTSLLQHSFFWRTSTLWNQMPGNFFPDGYNLQRFKSNVLDNWKGGITIGESKIFNLRSADDTTLIAASEEELVALLNVLEQHSAAYGRGINYKTKVIIVDREHDNHREIKSIGRCEVVQSFVYLGSVIDNSGSCENEIRRRIQQARVDMTKLAKIWRDHNITKLPKCHWFNRAPIYAFETRTWRRMLRIPYTAHRTNVSILDELCNPKRLSSIVSMRMLTFLGHIHRSDNMEKLQVYESSSARVRIDSNLSGQTATRKGVRQGCVLSPMLFNIYSEAVMRQTKVIIVDREHDNHREIKSIGRYEVVQSFGYLGSLIDNSGSCENEIRRRIQQARVAMTKLTKIWRDHNITKATKMSLVQSLVFSIFLYASETWTVKKADRARIDSFEMWMWRRMLRIPYTVHRTNVSILDELGNPKRLSSIVSMRMLTFFGHIHRSDNMEKLVVQGHAPSGRRRGRSPTHWVDTTKHRITEAEAGREAALRIRLLVAAE
ncbi:unnamed protein product [Callosobruchus maculatus]|uniref:Uncharacterized protein n=1 Tax=Callosobruchus maculatus TaxID=64391 RepID=A0A653BMB5_CALMS|nr:unnamed protein product [Callosobruchus maculatus]